MNEFFHKFSGVFLVLEMHLHSLMKVVYAHTESESRMITVMYLVLIISQIVISQSISHAGSTQLT